MLITALTLFIYATLITWLIVGWRKSSCFIKSESINHSFRASIVVACKNEATTLPLLLEALKNQTYTNFELILVDDNSTDNTFQLMQTANSFQDVIILKSNRKGKKQALKTGIEQASNQLIITTDADCTPSSTWIQTILNFYEQQSPDLIIGPVEMKTDNSLFQNIQQLEFQSLIAAGAGAAGNKQAIMCNGANLAFHKSEWLAQFSQLKPHLQSGDDVFYLHALKREGRKIGFLNSKQALVFTKSCTSIKQFYNQRKRWASKAPSYTDTYTIVIALIIFGTSSIQLISAIASLFNTAYILHFALITSVKCIIDWIFINHTNDLFEKRKTAKSTIALTVVYPFYITIAAFAGIAQNLIGKRKESFR